MSNGEATEVPYREDKLAELILYIAEKTADDRSAGATKLNKYLYFADFAAVRRLGRPITGAEYQKLRFGPAPRRLAPVRDRLLRENDARLDERVDALGYTHHRLIPERDPRTDLFTPEELRLVDEVIEALRELSAIEVSELSHREAGWQLVDEGETIPYELAFVLAPTEAELTPAIRAEGERIRREYGDRLA
ncbi:MAG: Panacea domain-containing protein [Actinomycetota bacterium]|nr:Panacea domain-containing protein [Actinomycetota bacterium]